MALNNEAWDNEIFGTRDMHDEEIREAAQKIERRNQLKKEEQARRPRYEDAPPQNPLAQRYLLRLGAVFEADASGERTEDIDRLMQTIKHLFSDLLDPEIPRTLSPEEENLVAAVDEYEGDSGRVRN